MKNVPTKIVLDRCRRRFKTKGLELKVARGARAIQSLGDIYVLDPYNNTIVEQGYRWSDLEQLALDMNALCPGDRVAP
jgi:hypothetical protein